MSDKWLIWSNEHRAWWRANRCGYTNKAEEAGRYSLEEANAICCDGGQPRSWSSTKGPYEMMIPAPEAMDKIARGPKPDTRDSAEKAQTFQDRVHPWVIECFGATIANDREERNHRFLEEALELVQAIGCTKSEANQLVDYVYNRPAGQPRQEVGGVMVTLAALCLANNINMHDAGETELSRVWGKKDAIRAKQAGKPRHSPLPQHDTAETLLKEAEKLQDRIEEVAKRYEAAHVDSALYAASGALWEAHDGMASVSCSLDQAIQCEERADETADDAGDLADFHRRVL